MCTHMCLPIGVKIHETKTDRTATFIVGEFNSPVSEMNRSSRQKINKDIAELNNTINYLNIMDIYRLLYPTTAE